MTHNCRLFPIVVLACLGGCWESSTAPGKRGQVYDYRGSVSDQPTLTTRGTLTVWDHGGGTWQLLPRIDFQENGVTFFTFAPDTITAQVSADDRISFSFSGTGNVLGEGSYRVEHNGQVEPGRISGRWSFASESPEHSWSGGGPFEAILRPGS